MLVGREEPLAGIRQALAQALQGGGSLVLVHGDAGIGKSRLLEAAVALAEAGGVPVARGYALDDAGCPPLWPWLRLTRPWPKLYDTLTGVRSAHTSVDPAERFELMVSVSDELRRLADRSGLVLVFEDLHWADRTSLLLLRHLTAELATSRLLVLASHRAPTGEPLMELLPELVRGSEVRQLQLNGLTAADVREWVQQVPELAQHPRLAELLHERTSGNPLLLRLLTEAVVSTPGLRARAQRNDGAAPFDGAALFEELLAARSDLRSLVAERVLRMSLASRRVVEAASVLGERINPALLAAVLRLGPAAVAEALDEAVAAQVLGARPSGPAQLAFVHGLVRDAVYAGLAPSVRADVHRRAAVALAALDGPPVSSLVAAHWQRSDAVDASARAAPWWAAAAREAFAALAYDEAAAAAERALQCVRALGAGSDELAAALLQLAEARFAAGRVDPSLTAVLTELAELGEQAGDVAMVASAGLVIHGMGTREVNDVNRRLCTQALALLDDPPERVRMIWGSCRPPGDPGGWDVIRARLLTQVAVAVAEDEGGPRAAELSSAALDAAEATGDTQAVLEALSARHLAISVPQAVLERMALGRRAVEVARGSQTPGAAAPQPMSELWGHLWLVDAALQLGNLAELEHELSQIDRVAQVTRSPLARWHYLRLSATYAALVGEFTEARRDNLAAKTLAEQMGNHQAASLFFAFLGQLALLRGDPEELRVVPDDVMEHAPQMPLVRISLAVAAAQRGDLDRARAMIDSYRALPVTFPLGPHPWHAGSRGSAARRHRTGRGQLSAARADCRLLRRRRVRCRLLPRLQRTADRRPGLHRRPSPRCGAALHRRSGHERADRRSAVRGPEPAETGRGPAAYERGNDPADGHPAAAGQRRVRPA